MQDLSQLRSEIDQIHEDIFDLVVKRFNITTQIWRYKKTNQLPFFDEAREQQLVHHFDDRFDNESDRVAFQGVMKTLISSSKQSAEKKI